MRVIVPGLPPATLKLPVEVTMGANTPIVPATLGPIALPGKPEPITVSTLPAAPPIAVIVPNGVPFVIDPYGLVPHRAAGRR